MQEKAKYFTNKTEFVLFVKKIKYTEMRKIVQNVGRNLQTIENLLQKNKSNVIMNILEYNKTSCMLKGLATEYVLDVGKDMLRQEKESVQYVNRKKMRAQDLEEAEIMNLKEKTVAEVLVVFSATVEN